MQRENFFYRIFMCEIKVCILFSSAQFFFCLFVGFSIALNCSVCFIFHIDCRLSGDDLDSLQYFISSIRYFLDSYCTASPRRVHFGYEHLCGCLLFSYSQSLLSCSLLNRQQRRRFHDSLLPLYIRPIHFSTLSTQCSKFMMIFL